MCVPRYLLIDSEDRLEKNSNPNDFNINVNIQHVRLVKLISVTFTGEELHLPPYFFISVDELRTDAGSVCVTTNNIQSNRTFLVSYDFSQNRISFPEMTAIPTNSYNINSLHIRVIGKNNELVELNNNWNMLLELTSSV